MSPLGQIGRETALEIPAGQPRQRLGDGDAKPRLESAPEPCSGGRGNNVGEQQRAEEGHGSYRSQQSLLADLQEVRQVEECAEEERFEDDGGGGQGERRRNSAGGEQTVERREADEVADWLRRTVAERFWRDVTASRLWFYALRRSASLGAAGSCPDHDGTGGNEPHLSRRLSGRGSHRPVPIGNRGVAVPFPPVAAEHGLQKV